MWGQRQGADRQEAALIGEFQIGRLQEDQAAQVFITAKKRTRAVTRDELETVIGYADAPLHLRRTFRPAEYKGGRLSESLLHSADNTII